MGRRRCRVRASSEVALNCVGWGAAAMAGERTRWAGGLVVLLLLFAAAGWWGFSARRPIAGPRIAPLRPLRWDRGTRSDRTPPGLYGHPRASCGVCRLAESRRTGETITVDLGIRSSPGRLWQRLKTRSFSEAVSLAKADLAVARANRIEASSALEIAEREMQRASTLRERGG